MAENKDIEVAMPTEDDYDIGGMWIKCIKRRQKGKKRT